MSAMKRHSAHAHAHTHTHTHTHINTHIHTHVSTVERLHHYCIKVVFERDASHVRYEPVEMLDCF